MESQAVPAWPGSERDLTLQYKVHLGLWTDWSRGRVVGQTLTLNREHANLLIAFTASFVVFVGARFWRIICLFLHQVYSTSDARDALHHQRQVLLRNSGCSDSGAVGSMSIFSSSLVLTAVLQFRFIALLHAWRHSSFKSAVRVAPALTLAAAFAIGFTIAGGYSSKIFLGGDNRGSAVLLKGTDCTVISNVTSMAGQLSFEDIESKVTVTANNYVQQCYSANSTGLTDCNYFVSPRLPGFVDNAAPCPFKESLCRNKSTNTALDTGYINTDIHLGLNAPPEERMFVRHLLHCAPLLTEGHSSVHGNSTRYDYGSYAGDTNFTYEVPSSENQYAVSTNGQVVETSYMLRSVTPRCNLSGVNLPCSAHVEMLQLIDVVCLKSNTLISKSSILTIPAHTEFFTPRLPMAYLDPLPSVTLYQIRSSSGQMLTFILYFCPATVSSSPNHCMMTGTEPLSLGVRYMTCGMTVSQYIAQARQPHHLPALLSGNSAVPILPTAVQ